MVNRCPDCDRPLATGEDVLDPEACFRLWGQPRNICIRPRVDWRARAAEYRTAYEDAAAMLVEVAEERDRLAAELEDSDMEAGLWLRKAAKHGNAIEAMRPALESLAIRLTSIALDADTGERWAEVGEIATELRALAGTRDARDSANGESRRD